MFSISHILYKNVAQKNGFGALFVERERERERERA